VTGVWSVQRLQSDCDSARAISHTTNAATRGISRPQREAWFSLLLPA